MPDDGIRVATFIVGWTIMFVIVVFWSLAAYRRGRLDRWVVAALLALVLGLQPVVASFAAVTPLTSFIVFEAVALFAVTLAVSPGRSVTGARSSEARDGVPHRRGPGLAVEARQPPFRRSPHPSLLLWPRRAEDGRMGRSRGRGWRS